MAYRLEQWTDSVYQIKQGRTKIGSVFQRDSDKKWVGRVKDDYVIADSPREAFQDIVRVLNRISICGVNNEEKHAWHSRLEMPKLQLLMLKQ